MIFLLILFLSAFFISSVAAWFSVAGLIAIFPSANIAVGLMGIALEIGKLVTASWLYRYWEKANTLIKTYFITAVCVLSFITSIGIFGYLTRAHMEGTQGANNNAEQITLLDVQIQQEKDNITNNQNALQQLNIAVNNLSAEVRTTDRAVRVRNSQKQERDAITAAIRESNKKLNELQKQRSVMSVDQRRLETEVGPIKYVAELVYSSKDTDTIEKAIRLLTLLLIFVFDPLAILLVIAANMHLNTIKDQQAKSTFIKMTAPKNKPEPDNVTEFKPDWNWNPGNWFKMVKEPPK